jgi:hypothetical protein
MSRRLLTERLEVVASARGIVRQFDVRSYDTSSAAPAPLAVTTARAADTLHIVE